MLQQKRFLKAQSILLSILMGAPALSWANGSLPGNVSVRNGGLAGAGVAMPEDPGTLYINPALGTNLGNEFVLSNFMFVFRNEVNGYGAGIPVKDSNTFRDVFALGIGANYHIKENLAIGVTTTGAGGGTVFHASPYMPDTLHPNTAINLAGLIAVPVSYSPNSKLAVGAGPVIGFLGVRTDASLQSPWEPIDTSLGIGASFGVKYDLTGQFSLGASLQTPVIFQKLYSYADIFTTNPKLPMTSAVGLAWHLSPATDLLFDIDSAYWSHTSSAGLPPPRGNGWKTRNSYRLGGQYRANEKITLRAGYQYSPLVIEQNNVFPANVFSSTTPLLDTSIHLGGSYQYYKTLSIDMYYAYGFKKTLTDDGTGYGGPLAKGYTILGAMPMDIGIGITWNYDGILQKEAMSQK